MGTSPVLSGVVQFARMITRRQVTSWMRFKCVVWTALGIFALMVMTTTNR